ncbi:MAG: TolC family protein [Acidobacteria bacterium]|nr:TolC family protein [Acidobacteriota bacterium]NIQ30675.1 TolC family protein [Acidobacteriota bacterium]NIQ85633.1 TolC family protein [Acidobacteriota bacterium]
MAALTVSDLPAQTDFEAVADSGPEIAGSLSVDRFHVSDGQLGELIRTLLAESPSLSSGWARSESSFERVPQARSLPDPMLSYRYFAVSPETRVGPQEHMLEVSQGVPWGGKRRLQAERAEHQAAGVTWEVENLERRLVAELKRSYFEAAYLQEALTVNTEERDLLRRFESIALKRYSTGQGIQQSVVKVQTDISRLDDRETELRERLDVVTRRLAELIGRPEEPLELRPIDLNLPDLDFNSDELERSALTEHPRVRAVLQRVEADQVWAQRRRLESKPDFRFGLGYTSVADREDLAGTISPPQDNGQDILAFTVGVNIPIYRKRIRAGIAEAHESGRANEELLAAVRDRLRFDVQESLVQLESLGERGRLYLDVIIPQAEESLASAEAAYTTARLGFLDLLDAERILFQSRLAYHRLVADTWVALANLEFAIASPFPRTDHRLETIIGSSE